MVPRHNRTGVVLQMLTFRVPAQFHLELRGFQTLIERRIEIYIRRLPAGEQGFAQYVRSKQRAAESVPFDRLHAIAAFPNDLPATTPGDVAVVEPRAVRTGHGGGVFVEPPQHQFGRVVRRDHIVLNHPHQFACRFAGQSVVDPRGCQPDLVADAFGAPVLIGQSRFCDRLSEMPHVLIVALRDPTPHAASEPRILTGIHQHQPHLVVRPGLLLKELAEPWPDRCPPGERNKQRDRLVPQAAALEIRVAGPRLGQ